MKMKKSRKSRKHIKFRRIFGLLSLERILIEAMGSMYVQILMKLGPSS